MRTRSILKLLPARVPLNVHPPCRTDDTWEEGFYRARRLINHRVAHDGAREYLVAWYGRKKNGEPWEDSWHAEEDVTSDLVAEYLHFPSCGRASAS